MNVLTLGGSVAHSEVGGDSIVYCYYMCMRRHKDWKEGQVASSLDCFSVLVRSRSQAVEVWSRFDVTCILFHYVF